MARRGSVERVLIGCGALTILGVLAVVLLGLGALLGSSDVEVPVEEPIEDILDGQDEEEPAPEAEARPVGAAPVAPEGVAPGLSVRVSGQPGTAYSGTYGTTRGGMVPVEGVLGAEPAEYGIETGGGGAFGDVSAVFRKDQLVPGALRAEVLSAGEVVAEGYTSEESSLVEVNWSPPRG